MAPAPTMESKEELKAPRGRLFEAEEAGDFVFGLAGFKLLSDSDKGALRRCGWLLREDADFVVVFDLAGAC